MQHKQSKPIKVSYFGIFQSKPKTVIIKTTNKGSGPERWHKITYDYRKAIKEDVKDYIEWNKADYEGMDREELEEKLNDELWVVDSVTGNASGSYTFNTAKAREYVEGNMVLCIEALREFGYELNHLAEKMDAGEWEYLDVTIRCYLLGQAINEVLDDMENE